MILNSKEYDQNQGTLCVENVAIHGYIERPDTPSSSMTLCILVLLHFLLLHATLELRSHQGPDTLTVTVSLHG